MPTFVYTALDQSGKSIKGKVEADSEQLVLAKLHEAHYHVVEVKIVPPKGLPPVKAHWRTGYYAPTE
jgi:type II secretory pathway component PulF